MSPWNTWVLIITLGNTKIIHRSSFFFKPWISIFGLKGLGIETQCSFICIFIVPLWFLSAPEPPPQAPRPPVAVATPVVMVQPQPPPMMALPPRPPIAPPRPPMMVGKLHFLIWYRDRAVREATGKIKNSLGARSIVIWITFLTCLWSWYAVV